MQKIAIVIRGFIHIEDGEDFSDLKEELESGVPCISYGTGENIDIEYATIEEEIEL